MKERISGIYCIKNLIYEKVYIGQSVNLYKRLCDHKSDLKHNRHHNTYLQHAFNKYGDENFDFNIIHECSIDELDSLETYYICEVYHSNDRNFGYNRESGGNSKKIVSEETKQKISKAGKKRFENPEEIEKNREHILKRFEDLSEHERMSKIQKKRFENPEEIIKSSEARQKFLQSENGIQWKNNYKEIMSKYWKDEEWCKKQISQRGTKIVQLNLDMTIENIWLSQKQVTRELPYIHRPDLSKCLSNTYGKYGNGYKNYIWLKQSFYESFTEADIIDYQEKYKNYNFENEKFKNAIKRNLKNRIIQLNLDITLVQIWESANEPKRQGTEFCSSSIRRCCDHKTKSYKGFIWMYESEYLELQKTYGS